MGKEVVFFDKEVVFFDNIKIEKQKLYYSESSASIYNVDINKIILTNDIPFVQKRFEDFIGYENDYEKVMPLCIRFPKMNAYIEKILMKQNIRSFIKSNELL